MICNSLKKPVATDTTQMIPSSILLLLHIKNIILYSRLIILGLYSRLGTSRYINCEASENSEWGEHA